MKTGFISVIVLFDENMRSSSFMYEHTTRLDSQQALDNFDLSLIFAQCLIFEKCLR